MLFDMRFREGVRNGAVTLTFRAWKRRQAKPGSIHRVFGDTRIAITTVDTVRQPQITDDDARCAGFEGREALVHYLREGPGGDAGDDALLYKVAFTFAGHVRDTPMTVDDSAVTETVAKLAEIDRRSTRGPWTREALALVREMPATRAGDLAERAGRERLKFKADVRKLKYLGLTRSLGTGYELTELGERVLAKRE